jgi:TolA-binding protein
MRRTPYALMLGLAISGFWASARAQTAGDEVVLRGFQTANGLLGRGMNDLAAEEYRKFLSEHADHAQAATARYGLAVALFRLGDVRGCRAELERVVGADGFEFAAESRVLLGQCRLAEGDYPGAGDAFEGVVRDFGSRDLADDAAGLLVEARYRQGDYAAAEAAAASFERRRPESSGRDRAELFRGLSLLAAGRSVQAAERFGALATAAKASEVRERAAILRAQSLHRAGDIERASKQYASIIESGTAFEGEALLGLAALRHERGSAKEALPLLDRLLAKFADGTLADEARLRRGRARLDLEDYASARQDFEAVQRAAGGKSDEAAYWLAKCDLRAGRADDAATALSAAIDRYPTSRLAAEMHYDLAVAQARAGRDEGAWQTLAGFQGRFPDHALAPEAAHLTALVAHRRRDYDSSLAACREFLRRFPDHALVPAVEFLAAENLLLSGHESEAAGAYRAFLDGRPNDARRDTAAFRLGTVLHRLGRPEEARPWLERVAKGARTLEEFRGAVLLLGDIAFGAGDWETARRRMGEYVGFGRDQPSADDALLKLGLACARQGDHGSAIQAFDTLLAGMGSSPSAVQARFERGQSLVALGRGVEAAAEFDRVLAEAPGSKLAAYAHNHLGSLASARGEQEAAVEHFRQAAAGGADLELDARFREAMAYAAAGRHQEAFDTFAKVAGELPSDAGGPRAVEAWARRAIELSRLGRFEEAIKALEAAPRAGLAPSLLDAMEYEKGWCLRRLKRPDEAATVFRGLLAPGHDPGLRLYAMTDLAELEADAGRHEAAVDLLGGVRAAGNEAPNDLRARATYLQGVSEFRLERFDRAATLMDEFLSGPSGALEASALLVAGESRFRLGRHEQAAERLRQMIEKHGDDPGCATAMLRLGESLAALQRWGESERVFEAYLDRFKDSELWFQAGFGLGWARENQGRHEEAITAYRGVAERHRGPTAARAQFQLGECMFALGRHDEAAKELLKVDILYAYPEWSAAALYEAGRCFEAMNDPDRARAQYAAVKERFGQTRWAALASQRLDATRTKAPPGRG